MKRRNLTMHPSFHSNNGASAPRRPRVGSLKLLHREASGSWSALAEAAAVEMALPMGSSAVTAVDLQAQEQHAVHRSPEVAPVSAEKRIEISLEGTSSSGGETVLPNSGNLPWRETSPSLDQAMTESIITPGSPRLTFKSGTGSNTAHHKTPQSASDWTTRDFSKDVIITPGPSTPWEVPSTLPAVRVSPNSCRQHGTQLKPSTSAISRAASNAAVVAALDPASATSGEFLCMCLFPIQCAVACFRYAPKEK